MDVYRIKRGHTRSTIFKHNGKFIVALGLSENYAEPGTVFNPKEEHTQYILGLEIEGSEDLRNMAKNFMTMANWLDEKENVECEEGKGKEEDTQETTDT